MYKACTGIYIYIYIYKYNMTLNNDHFNYFLFFYNSILQCKHDNNAYTYTTGQRFGVTMIFFFIKKFSNNSNTVKILI